MSSTETITAQYVARFRCLGGACEDNCCQGWGVQIDRHGHRALEHAMSGTEAEREEFRRNVDLDQTSNRSDARYAWIKLESKTCKCPFLNAEQLCSVQRRYGEEALPRVCSTYPRNILRSDDRTEVWGTLSCPELARQCLLHEDAMDLVDAPTAAAAGFEPETVLGKNRTPYQRYLDDVRFAAFKLLSLRDYPIGTRLFLLAYLGEQTAGFFNRDATDVDEDRLVAAIDHVSNPQTIDVWHRELGKMPAPEALAANLVNQMIIERLKVVAGSFRQLVDKTLSTYRDGTGTAINQKGASLVDLWAAYAVRRKTWLDISSTRIDLYFENYAKNFWMREWYLHSSDLLTHTHRLLTRVAVLRFMLFSHPALKDLDTGDLEIRRATLDRVAVEVFYKVSRALEHDHTFIDLIAQRLVAQGSTTFTHATVLALL